MSEDRKVLAEIDGVVMSTGFTHSLNKGDEAQKYGDRFGHLYVIIEFGDKPNESTFKILVPQKYAGEIKPGESVRVSITRQL